MDFIALDVETANADMSSICSIGLVHFKNGQVYRDLSSLIDPEDHFDPVNTSIHGIRPEDVVGKPNMRAAYPSLAANLANCVVVHHTHFDRTAFRKVAAKLSLPEFTCNWLDSAKMARRAWQQLSSAGYGLANLAAEFKIEFRHHQAAEDARCAGMIALQAVGDTGIPIEQWCEYFDHRTPWPIDFDAAGKRSPRVKLAGNPDGPLFGEVVAFTGSLTIERAAAAEMAAVAGCEVCSGVTKRTTILVVGDQDIRVLNGQDRSAKHRKAEQLIVAGCPIRIVCESDFRALVASDRASA